MSEMIMNCIIWVLERGAKGFWTAAAVLLLILPFGIPILLLIGFVRLLQKRLFKNRNT
jgi:hypothetical protein